MTSDEGLFWDKRFREEGAIWGEAPSPTAVLLAGMIAPPARILDVGFGYGRDLVYLAGCGFRVSGIDTSAGGQALAQARLNHLGLKAEQLWLGRFESTNLPAGRFDAVLNHRMAHLLTSADDVAEFAAAIRRVLAPGGILALAARSLADHDPAAMKSVGGGVYEYRGRPGHRIRYWGDESVQLLCDAGFDLLTYKADVEPETLSKPVPCHLLLLVTRKSAGRPGDPREAATAAPVPA